MNLIKSQNIIYYKTSDIYLVNSLDNYLDNYQV